MYRPADLSATIALLTLLATCTMAAAATPAFGSTVDVAQETPKCLSERGCPTYTYVVYRAAAGERNVVSFQTRQPPAPEPNTAPVRDADPLTITDMGAMITPAPANPMLGCKAVAPHSVDCYLVRPATSEGYDLLLGDGDDSAVLPAAYGDRSRVNLGPGNDSVSGSELSDDLDGGGGGRDVLSGRGGADALTDGDGDADADADVIDGGPGGYDTVSYVARKNAVTVDLGAMTGGAAGENDALSGVESAYGGAGDDRLVGTDGVNQLVGGGGSDALAGAGGNDSLVGGEGSDELSGGAGDDELDGGDGPDELSGGPGDDKLAGEGGADRISCGAGWDLVRKPAAGERLASDCEMAGGDGNVAVGPIHPLAYRGRTAVLRLHCQLDVLEYVPCEGTVTIRRASDDQLLGRARFHIRREHRKAIGIRLTSAGLRAIRSAHPDVSVTIRQNVRRSHPFSQRTFGYVTRF